MSEEGGKLEEDGTLKTSGRVRICKHCRFTTTDVREFSKHRLTAHSEVVDEKTATRRNSLKTAARKTSRSSLSLEDGGDASVVNEVNTTSKDLVLKIKLNPSKDGKEAFISSRSEQSISETKHTEQSSEKIEQHPAKEFLDSLNLGAKSNSNSTMSKREESDTVHSEPGAVKMIMENGNGLSEEVLLVNKDDDADEEGRLVIAEEGSETSENHDLSLALQNESRLSLTRSGNIQNRTYICNVCEFSTTSAKLYLHHQKDLHCQDILIYECDICEYATKYKQKLPRHRKLHFSGKDGNGMSGSDLDNSMSEKELREARETMEVPRGETSIADEDGEEDDDVEEDEEEEEVVPVVSQVSAVPEQVEKKKRIRQEVDPAKYFEVFDDVGIKYACSKCGNVYKWRKSLNKHWKEKHFGETPNLANPPPTLQNYTLFSRFKTKFSSTPSPSPTTVNTGFVHGAASVTRNITITPTSSSKSEEVTSSVVMPKFIGPFIAGTNQAVFNPAHAPQSLLMNLESRKEAVRQQQLEAMARQSPAVIDDRKATPKGQKVKDSGDAEAQNSQMEPIDFSVKKGVSEIKTEIGWDEEDMDSNCSDAAGLNEPQVLIGQDPDDPSKQYPVLQCSKCAFIAKTLVDYSSHMTLHLNKRAFKCAECQEHFNGVEDLNKHFAEFHAEKIQEHKEAIQKIPHGLQQTYHLLKMPLDAISSLSSQELLSSEPKQLKCSMCSFVAKWPAELQKHAVSHSEERPFVCMVCGSTYKWKWDLVKHFEKSHHTLPNPYKRRDQPGAGGGGGMISKSPSVSPQIPTISKTAVALLDASMTRGGFIVSEEDPPLKKKRRLSDTDMPVDSDDFYELNSDRLQEEMKSRKLYHNDMPQRPSSEPSQGMQDESFESEMDDQKLERYMDRDGNLYEIRRSGPSPGLSQKQNGHMSIQDALKMRITTNKLQQEDPDKKNASNYSDVLLPYKCSICEYRARWPSEISQHMKNHSNEKPFHCPRCSYRSKWKWDVVKHLRRCGGGTVHDVIDMSKIKKMAPPNVMVLPQGSIQQQTPQPGGTVFVTSQTSPSPSSSLSQQSSDSGSPSLTVVPTPNFSVSLGGQEHPNNLTSKSVTVTPTNTLASPGSQKQTVFRSLINQGMYYCLECPFIGMSPAELRRHSVLHSENKPFTCNMCGYSSRWKCDLKKHMKTYGHYNSTQVDSDGPDMDTSLEKDDADSDEEQRSTLYMCPKCPYNTYKKQAYMNHLLIHGDQIDEPALSTSPAKFKCSKCDYQGNDLSSFLQHKVSHSSQQTGTVTSGADGSGGHSGEMSSRTLHLKHRRKPVQQFHCPKCPYVCFKRGGLSLHETMHQPRGADAFPCLYCDYNVFSRSLLYQHMLLHPEYNPSECPELGRVGESELRDIEEMEEKDAAGLERKKLLTRMEENNNIEAYENGLDMDTSENVLDFSSVSTLFGGSSRTSPPSSQSILQSGKMSWDKGKAGGLPCEWCSATFPNVVTLYQHAQGLHPDQLKAQETGEPPKQSPARKHTVVQSEKQAPEMQLDQQKLQFSSPVTSLNTTQSSERKYVTLLPKASPQPSQAPPPAHSAKSSTTDASTFGFSLIQAHSQSPSAMTPYQLAVARARKSTSPQKRSRSFQCTKCSFTAPNAVTYLRHIERHGSNCKHTCRYCDYSIDRLNLLYQHMKGTHGNLWKGTAEEKINLSVNGEDSNNNLISGNTESPESFNMSDNSEDNMNGSFGSYNESNDGDSLAELKGSYDGGVLPVIGNKGVKPVLVIREETTWRGIPVQVCSLDGKKHYKCPKCYYISSNAANTTNHVRQHGSNRKYTCPLCDYSVDNLKLIQHHMESVHPKEPTFVQVSSSNFASTPSASTQPSEEMEHGSNSEAPTNLSMKPTFQKQTDQISQKEHAAQLYKARPFNINMCPKCPFVASNTMQLQRHLERHEYEGKYECQLCDYSVDRYCHLRKHARLHNRKYDSTGGQSLLPDEDEILEPEMSLPEGSASTSKLDLMDDKVERQQIQELQAQIKHGAGRLRYKCARCPFNTFCKNNIIKHRRQHLIKGNFACQLCTYSASRAYLLQQHLKFHNESDKASMSESEKFQDIVLDPFDDTKHKLLQQVTDPYENDKTELEEEIEDFEDEEMEESGEGFEDFEEGMAEDMDEMGDDEDEDDIEAAMMEEELQDSGIVPEDLRTDRPAAVNNLEASFDTELQFRNYKCPDCPYSSNSAAEYRKHGRLHGANLKFQCDYCTYSLDRVNLLSQHRKLHFQEPDFDASPPTSKLLNKNHEDFASTSSKLSQELASAELSPATPKQDDSLADCRYVYQKTALPSAAMMSDDKIRYMCNRCPYRCNALKSYKCHIQMHGLNRKYKCDYCNWSADRLNLLYQHRKVHAREPGFNPNPGDIVFLNRKYALDSEIVEKMNFGSGIVGVALAQTPKSPFTSEDVGVFQTAEAKQGSKKFYCKVCPFQTDSANEHAYHKKLHCIEARFDCSVCSFAASSLKSLEEHMKLHKKEGGSSTSNSGSNSTMILVDNKTRHKCSKCPYSSPNKNLLAVHATMHAAGKKYTCRFCDYSIDRYNLLRQHMKIHLGFSEGADSPANSEDIEMNLKKTPDVIGPQIYFSPVKGVDLNDSDSNGSMTEEQNCDRCPYSTPSKEELVAHEIQHSAHGKHNCLYCTFGCSSEEELVEHTQLHFPSTTIDKDVLRTLKDRQGQGHGSSSHKRNISKSLASSEKGLEKGSRKTAEEDGTGEPDSTVTDGSKTEGAEKAEGSGKGKEGSEKEETQTKTKVYVCQFCEREFEGKSQMIQHEKQHYQYC